MQAILESKSKMGGGPRVLNGEYGVEVKSIEKIIDSHDETSEKKLNICGS